MNLKQQKYLVILFLFLLNTLLSTTFIIYEKNWYIYIFILGLASSINSFSSLLALGYKMTENNDSNDVRFEPKNYVYVMPCYNENEEELFNTLNSITLQRVSKGDKRLLLIICDGIVKGKGNDKSTDALLKNMLNINDIGAYYEYKTWDNTNNVVTLYKGEYSHSYESIPFILIIKQLNYGKRDSLVLIRYLCYEYNLYKSPDSYKCVDIDLHDSDLLKEIVYDFNIAFNKEPVDYIIGTDADTILAYNCSDELIKSINKDKNIHGCVGYVDISFPKDKSNKYINNIFSPYYLYQYAEYMFSQCLRRYVQSNITNKVTCLSGCNQILRVSYETCGPAILKRFNYLPKEDENIFKHILSYASEDRNHVCNMLSLYPHVKTTQNLKAVAYTNIPKKWEVFLSQRRRWCLGANTNDMLLVNLSDINKFEKISAFVNVMTFSLSPFVFIATIFFLRALFTNPSMLMLYLSTIMIIPFGYGVLIPIFIRPLSFRNACYYYCSYAFFLIFGSFINLIIYFYSIFNMNVIKWGKTRQIDVSTIKDAMILIEEKQEQELEDNSSISNNSISNSINPEETLAINEIDTEHTKDNISIEIEIKNVINELKLDSEV
jgi:chitin synthase